MSSESMRSLQRLLLFFENEKQYKDAEKKIILNALRVSPQTGIDSSREVID